MTEATMQAPETGTFNGFGGFWIRFVALFIDNIVISIATGPIYYLMIMPKIDFQATTPEAAVQLNPLMGPGYLLCMLIPLAYFIYMEGAKGATIGKMALGLKVVGENGQPIGMGAAAGRTFGKIVSGIILYIGFIMAGFDPRKQALHDKLAKTLVVKK